MPTPPPDQQNRPDSNRPEPQEDGPLYSTSPQQPAQVASISLVPQAPLHWRLLAAVLDIVLVALVSLLLLSRVLLPMDHPEAYDRYFALLNDFNLQVQQAYESGQATPSIQAMLKQMGEDEGIVEMEHYSVGVAALCLIVYFVLCERFMRGGSVGKAVFRLRVISLRTGTPPSLWESLGRSVCKWITLTPILWVSYLAVFFNRLRRAGHDWVGGTVVVSDIVQIRQEPAASPAGNPREGSGEDF